MFVWFIMPLKMKWYVQFEMVKLYGHISFSQKKKKKKEKRPYFHA